MIRSLLNPPIIQLRKNVLPNSLFASLRWLCFTCAWPYSDIFSITSSLGSNTSFVISQLLHNICLHCKQFCIFSFSLNYPNQTVCSLFLENFDVLFCSMSYLWSCKLGLKLALDILPIIEIDNFFPVYRSQLFHWAVFWTWDKYFHFLLDPY